MHLNYFKDWTNEDGGDWRCVRKGWLLKLIYESTQEFSNGINHQLDFPMMLMHVFKVPHMHILKLVRFHSYIKRHGLVCFVLSKYLPWWSSILIFSFGTCVGGKIIKWFDTRGEIWKLDWNICSLLPL
jgi:hypothetical protein